MTRIAATHGFGDPTTATFTMDGSSTVLGTYDMPTVNTPTFHNVIFNSSILPSGNHTVVMTLTPLGRNPNMFFDMITYTYDAATQKPTIGDIFVDDAEPILNYSSSATELLPTVCEL